MDKINESEKKRLESLKQKKQLFRAKELAVQNALKNLDTASNKNKIIFDDDVDKIVQSKVNEKQKKRKRDLFDNDDEEPVWDDSKFEVNKNTDKIRKQNITLGNDERFKLNKHFMENEESDENVTPSDNETDLQKEKKLQLDILENVLGAPVVSKNKDTNKDAKFTKKGMIRYDPTESSHKEYEIATEKAEPEIKKVKKKKKIKDNTEDSNIPVEVSKDIYFSVSESLPKSLNEGEQFSLLKAFGRETNNEKGDDNATNIQSLKPPKFQFDFNSKNPFKYDSSDDEHDTKQEYTKKEQFTNDVIRETNKFFFDDNDIRFNEARKFFSEEYAPEHTFKDLRQELKQIMRSKIQRNIRKKQPWGSKKKIKRLPRKSV